MEIQVNGVRLWYTVKGQGSPVILVHGNGESHRIFGPAIEDLSRDHRVYALDSRCHGNSQDTVEISYELMARDLMGFLKAVEIEKPAFYGFSDGGILGLMIAIEEPELLGRLIVSGANLNPAGLRLITRAGIRLMDLFRGSKLTKLMLSEPYIDPEDLGKIRVPTVVVAGQWDVVKRKHTEQIAEHIPGAVLRFLPGERHGSYIVNSPKLAPLLREYL